MNKIIHDTKTGLQPIVTSLAAKFNDTPEPQITALEASVETVTEATNKVSTTLTAEVQPSLRSLKLDIHDPG